MNSKMLLPHHFKAIGLIILFPCLILGILVTFYGFRLDWLSVDFDTLREQMIPFFGKITPDDFGNENYTEEIAYILMMVSLVFIAFSREEQEDEFIFKMRLESLLWAMYINVGLLILLTIFTYGLFYLMLIMLAPFAFLLIFIIRFNYLIHYKAR